MSFGFESGEVRNENIQAQISELLNELRSREKPVQLSEDSMTKLQEWVKRVNPIQNAPAIFAQHIKGLDVWKRIIALQTISQPQPFHAIAIGDPASGKSEVSMSFSDITQTTAYVFATKMTAAGLTLSRVGEDLAVGALPRCHMGQVFVDEFDKAPAAEAGALLGSMQHGWFSVEKATLKVPVVPAKTVITALANPLGDYWRSTHPVQIKRQLPFTSQALLTRFHLIVIIRRPDVKEFEAISKHQINAGMTELAHNALTDDDKRMWDIFVHYLRRVRINHYEHPQKSDQMITAFTTNAYQQDKKFRLAIPISPRLNDGILRISMAYAKSQLRETVTIKDTIRSIMLTAETLMPCGLDVAESFKAVKKSSGIPIEVD
jgi:DNA replicative helicase MCM subunit Mcm2 (Cdc46/Mcm family)